MIKTKKGKTKFTGTGSELMVDFTIITKSIKEMLIEEGISEKDARFMLQTSFELGMKPAEEVLMDSLKKLLDELADDEEDIDE